MQKSTFVSIAVSSILFCLAYSSTVFADENVGEGSASPIQINSVTISPDNQSNNVSTFIQLTNTGKTLTKWQIGFCYMQDPLIKRGNTNPDLVMQICDAKNNCSELKYKQKSLGENDLSAGYTSILAPAETFPLKNQTYTIKLLHSNQGMPGNYANVPQNFFLINQDNRNSIIHLHTTQATYDITSYNQGAIDAEIKQHLQTNWDNSSNQPSSNLIVPTPVSYFLAAGNFQFDNTVQIHDLLPKSSEVTKMFADDLQKDLNINASIDNAPSSTGIIIQTIQDPALIKNNPEGYQILIQPSSITINVLNDTGEFYALQTLRQLWARGPIASATITDYPRFIYRGIMLDTARHFFTVKQIEHLINLMAAHKLNTLHIHFGDDEGFRLGPITTTGGTRGYGQWIAPMVFTQGNLDITNYNHLIYPYADTRYSHSYSAADLQKLITYANARKITIIPEIDIPGHARALIKSFPSIFVDHNDHSIFTSVQGYDDNVIPVCTYNTTVSVGPQFTTKINQIVNQIATLFNLYNKQTTLYAEKNEVSVGADEVSPDAWSNDSSCQGESGLKALQKAQKFFQDMSESNPSLLFSGWQQLVQNDDPSLGKYVVAPDQVGHIWVWNKSQGGIAQAANLAENHYPTVLALADQTYLDLTYTPDIHEPGFTWATPFSDTHSALSSAVSATAVLNQIPLSDDKYIVGIEGALWSENLSTYQHLVYMALPKMAGVAEASWSPATVTDNNNQVDWHSLANRLGCGNTGFLAYLNKLFGVHYRGYPHGISLEVPVGAVCN